MITGARRGAAAGVENVAPPAEKLAKTMATKSTDAPASANNEFPPLRVKKLVPEALLPVRGSAGAAGYDLARCVGRHANAEKKETKGDSEASCKL